MNVFTIKDLENLSGIKAHTIRVWEQRYDFLKPQRTDTNIRYYHSHELKTVLDISLLNKYGYKISDLSRMSRDEHKSKIVLLSDKEALQDRLVNDLITYMVDFDIESFEEVLDTHALLHGIGKTIDRLIFPFLDRISILWIAGHINLAQEHLISLVIRQKLIVGIQRSPAPRPDSKTVLLFLPEGEHHELGLLYICYLLKSHGAHVLYLGADLPLRDLEAVCHSRNPDFLYSHLTTVGSLNTGKFFMRIPQRIGIPLIISGQAARARLRGSLPAGVDLRVSIPEVMAFIANL